MNWNEASNLIWNRFCDLDDNAQVEDAENSFAEKVFIFPMAKFNDFCKNVLNLDYVEVAEAVYNSVSYDEDEFDFHAPWCLYDPILKKFTTDESPACLVDDPDTLIENLMDEEALRVMLKFTEKEVDELIHAYESEDND